MTRSNPPLARLPPLGRLASNLVSSAALTLLVLAGAAHAETAADVQRLAASGQTAHALQKADEFLAAKPNDPQMRFVKGVILTDSKRSAEAIEVFRKLVEDYPDLAEPYNNLAALYASAGDYDQARAALEQALRANPNYAVARENLGDVYAMLASRAYDQALKLEPANENVPRKLALVKQMFAPKLAAAPTAAAAAASAP